MTRSLPLDLAFFVAALAVQCEADPRVTSWFGQHPFARAKRRIMTNVLTMATIENCPPMPLVILFKSCDSLLQFGF